MGQIMMAMDHVMIRWDHHICRAFKIQISVNCVYDV